ncbi:MAG: ABC transporter substrate-binding protein [Anaerolineales bacterium]|nr:ABC transporter substrate-binding protein [Anaerolineales bacterium]
MRKLFALMSLLVIASMALAACGTPAAPAAPAEPATTESSSGTTTQPSTESPSTEAPAASADFVSKDPTTFVVAQSEVGIDTFDPALAYDTASGEILQNVYETLVFYDGEATDKFVPQLAESWETSADGTVYTFKIRSGVKFHEGGDMTPSDVAYSFQRGLLQGGYSSPQWLLAEPFFGVGNDDITMLVDEGASADDRDALSANDSAKLVAACEKVQSAIVADDAAGTVTMTLAQPWGPFLATIAQSWGSIMDKEWVVKNGGWDGSCDTWQNFYGMTSADDPFSTIANGTGAFKIEKFANGEEIVLARNENYWREPAKLARVVLKQVPEWGTRFSMMQTGDADLATVPPANRSQMDELVGAFQTYDAATNTYGPTQEVCSYNASALGAEKFTACAAGEAGNGKPFLLRIGRPGVAMDVLLFNWNIATSADSPNPYIGSGKLDGNGIPADFFSDEHIRKGFAYAFDWDTLIDDVFSGEALQPYQLTLPGMPGFFPDTPHYTFDLDKATEEFKLADVDHDGIPAGEDPEGDVWTSGFRVQMSYNQGNVTRQTIAEILAGNLSEINDKFQIETLGLPWPAYLRAQRAKQIPLMTGGWQEDIHDPHNWYQPYTTGTYGGRQSLPDDVKDQFKEILNRGVAETDPAKRAEIYKEANQLYYDLAVGVPLSIVTTHGFAQRWIEGQILNPIFSGAYYYTISKK